MDANLLQVTDSQSLDAIFVPKMNNIDVSYDGFAETELIESDGIILITYIEDGKLEV